MFTVVNSIIILTVITHTYVPTERERERERERVILYYYNNLVVNIANMAKQWKTKTEEITKTEEMTPLSMKACICSTYNNNDSLLLLLETKR